MPSNVSFEYAIANKKYVSARTPEEKLAALLEMKSHAPSHKGGENLRADLNKKIAELKSEMERARASASKRGSASSAMYVKKDGIGQIAVLGLPNSGKSWLLNKLVGKQVAEVTPYPFATKEPVPGMMNYDGALIQMVELPALIEGSSDGKAQGREIIGVVRNSDAVLVVCRTADERRVLLEELEKAYIFLNKQKPPIIVKVSSFPGIQVSGKDFLSFSVVQLEQFLKNSGYTNAQVIISGKISSLSEVAEALNEKICYKPALFINPLNVTEHSLVDLRDQLFLLLGKVLVFTKRPGQGADMMEPIALVKGSTVFDLAKVLHKDFAKNLKFARLWGSSRFPGQRVGPEHVLKNKDIVEISA